MLRFLELTVLSAALILIGFSFAAFAQTPAATAAPRSDASIKLEKETTKNKKKIFDITKGNDVTIVRRDGKEFHGTITDIGDDSVIVNDVDLKANVEIDYQQIKSVDKGYSKKNAFGYRMPSKPRKIIGWVAVGVLAVIVVVVAATLRNPNF